MFRYSINCNSQTIVYKDKSNKCKKKKHQNCCKTNESEILRNTNKYINGSDFKASVHTQSKNTNYKFNGQSLIINY